MFELSINTYNIMTFLHQLILYWKSKNQFDLNLPHPSQAFPGFDLILLTIWPCIASNLVSFSSRMLSILTLEGSS